MKPSISYYSENIKPRKKIMSKIKFIFNPNNDTLIKVIEFFVQPKGRTKIKKYKLLTSLSVLYVL